MRDFIRLQAEAELGCKIPDIAWTYETRNMWKRFFHARNYGGYEDVKISISSPIPHQRVIENGK